MEGSVGDGGGRRFDLPSDRQVSKELGGWVRPDARSSSVRAEQVDNTLQVNAKPMIDSFRH